MRVSLKILSCLGLAAGAALACPDTVLRSRTLADLNKASSTSYFTRRNCDFVSLTTDSNGSPIATLRFKGTYASFGQDLSTSQDWSAYNLVQAKIKNNESFGVHYKLIVQLGSDPNSYANAFTGALYLGPKESKMFVFNLNVDSSAPYGMEYLRPVLSQAYTDVVAGTKFRNLSSIYYWRLSNQDSATSSLTISYIKLLRQNLVFNGITDKYGQYTDRKWSSKITQDSDFSSRKSDELTDLSANPGMGETTGSKALVNPSVTLGVWKTVRNSSGQMYLQHPNGKLFWSLGISAIGQGASTPVEGRSEMFQWLPSTTGTFAGAYMDRPTPDGTLSCISFNVVNLMRKYGTDYTSSWKSMVKKRLASWGVNTIGIQSAKDFLDNSFPYTLIEDTSGFKTRLRTPYALWGSMPDPYADGFQTWMTGHFTTDLADNLADSNFMGVFVDNEMSWGNAVSTDRYYNVPRGVLNSPSTQPAKIAFVDQLKAKYSSSISSLNTAWGTSFSSWSDLLSKQWLPRSYTSGMKSDFSTFLKAFADRYYSRVNGALSAAGIKALYLGSRFADWTPEVVSSAGKYVDVLSFNFYRTAPNIDWNYLNGLSRPVLISELGYGAKADGTFGGPATAFSQSDRSSKLKELLNKAITQKNIVGIHWYCYVDQPITGRWSDYENTGMGMVDVADNPYMASVYTLRSFTKTMYSVRG